MQSFPCTFLDLSKSHMHNLYTCFSISVEKIYSMSVQLPENKGLFLFEEGGRGSDALIV